MGHRSIVKLSCHHQRIDHHRGFTLIEILVVLFIMAAVLGMATLQLMRDNRDVVRDEADRLIVILQAAREDTILQGSLLTFEMRPEGYRFLQPGEKGKFIPIGVGPLAPRQWQEPMQARLEIDGQPALGRQSMVLDPSGSLPLFNIVFTLHDARWWVLGQQDGKIRSAPTADINVN